MLIKMKRFHVFLTAGLFAASLAAFAPVANAQCGNCSCDASLHEQARAIDASFMPERTSQLTTTFNELEYLLDRVLFREHVLPATMELSRQVSAVAMQQMFILGTLFDAKHQLETTRIFDHLHAQAHKEYRPSMAMCEFGTNVRSLASADVRADVTKLILSRRSRNRQTGEANTLGSEGPHADRLARSKQMMAIYCAGSYNGASNMAICHADGTHRRNFDVDYSSLIDSQKTIDFDLTDSALTDTERDIFALNANLFASDVPLRLPESLLYSDTIKDGNNNPNRLASTNAAHVDRLMQLRGVIAKRNVAENSFYSIVAQRVPGSPPALDPTKEGSSTETYKYMSVILKQLGIMDDKEISDYLGARPSYNAQMDVLTKKMYQRPEFYTNLIDSPANNDRKMVALQAIALMQDFDMLKSYHRQEMILSLLVELELEEEQSKIVDDLGSLEREGPVFNRETYGKD
jgi:hypothetical protein